MEEKIKIKCTCSCHSNPSRGMMHIVACCDNGYKYVPMNYYLQGQSNMTDPIYEKKPKPNSVRKFAEMSRYIRKIGANRPKRFLRIDVIKFLSGCLVGYQSTESDPVTKEQEEQYKANLKKLIQRLNYYALTGQEPTNPTK